MSDDVPSKVAPVTVIGTCGCCCRGRSILVLDSGICWVCARCFGLRNAFLTVRVREDPAFRLLAFRCLRDDVARARFVVLFGAPGALRLVK
jgi:hypothetical protein